MSRTALAAAWAAAAAGFLLSASFAAAQDEAAVAPRPAAGATGGNASWSLRLPEEGHVVFRGTVSFDEVGTGTGTMMYPAPSAAGFIAAVITHGLIADSAKKGQKDKLQTAADQVLVAYRPILDKFESRDLMRRALEKTSTGASGRLVEASAGPGPGMSVEAAPVFSLTQDQSAIIVDSVVAILQPGAAPEAIHRTTIRVVSAAKGGTNPASYWMADEGEKLKDESARLVAESLEIAFADAATGVDRDGIPYRTIRYREGIAEKIERAQVLGSRCDRLLIRTLRGALMSVPVAPATTLASAADRCRPDTVSSN